VREHAGDSQAEVMGYHVREQLPITYALADAGATCDRWFASVMGPTWPNRFYLHGATSNGNQSNTPAFSFRSIFDQLDDARVSHKNYFHDVAWAVGGYFKLSGNAPIEDFFDDAAAGRAAAVLADRSAVLRQRRQRRSPRTTSARPGAPGRGGERGGRVAALGRCLIVTYDEHGGFYDHVAPPVTIDQRAEFRQLGFRVPSVVLGPTVRRGEIVSTPLEHASIIATLCRRFGVAPLNARVTGSNDISGCLDPARLGAPHAPPTLPAVPMARAALAARPPSNAHAELAATLDAMDLPPGLDRRHDPAVTARFLAWAERLGAIRWLD
jgi:phospholipase C